MSLPPPAAATVETHAREHQQIRGLLALLRSVQDGAALATLLDVMEAAMQEHFAHEEASSGVFATIRAEDPVRGGEIDAFVAEHRVFLAGIAEVRARLELEAGEAVDLAHEMGLQLERHEAAENAAVRAALLDEA